MKCDICKNKAVVEQRHERQVLCKSCFKELFEKKIVENIMKDKLIESNDKIAIALSGGKDSATLIHILNQMKNKLKYSKIFAIIIDEGIRGYSNARTKTAEHICRELNIEFYIFSFKEEFGYTLDQIMKNVEKLKNPSRSCTYCGIIRRQLLNLKSRELKAKKIATGHNLDDEIQTFLMNFIRGDIERIARQGAFAEIIEYNRFVPRIKPLRNSLEREVALYAILNNIEFYSSTACPYATSSFRTTIADAINNIENQIPGSKLNILRNLDKLLPELKENFKTEWTPNNCSICGEPTSREICKMCEMENIIKIQ